LLNISWIIFNNECVVSYFYKILNDKKYQLGSNNEVEDYNIILGVKNANIYLMYIIIMYIFNIIVILSSDKINLLKIPLFASSVAFIVYMFSLRNLISNKNTLEKINLITNTVLLFVIFNFNAKELHLCLES